jgi:hypothetical protein
MIENFQSSTNQLLLAIEGNQNFACHVLDGNQTCFDRQLYSV